MNLLWAIVPLLMSPPTRPMDPFTNYVSLARTGKAPAVISSFTNSCGVQADGAKPVYGVGVGKGWKRTSDLMKALHNNDTDFFSTAELGLRDGKPTYIVLWSLELDTGSQIMSIFCLSDSGKVRDVMVTNWSLPVEKGDPEWTYRLTRHFADDGSIESRTGSFIDAKGRKIPRPPAARGIKGAFEWVPDLRVIAPIEAALLKSDSTKVKR